MSLRTWLSWLRAQPEAPVDKNQEEINASYRHWRLHIMLGLYAGYAVYYFTRRSFNSILPAMLDDLGWERAAGGAILSMFYIVYGVSRFVSGMMSDFANPRYFMGLGLIATGVINILFGFSSSLLAFTALWTLNAFFQGWGWPPCAKLMTAWYSRNERGFWWAICNTSHNVGGALIPLLAGALAMAYGWRYGMIVPGVIGIAVGLLLCVRLRDRPASMGLPTVGAWRRDELELEQERNSAKLPMWQVLRRYVFGNRFIWLLAASYLFVYVVRIGINDWGNKFLQEQHGYALLKANSAIFWLEVGGFIGTIVAGWGSDRFFRGNRVPMNIIFTLGILLSVLLLWTLRVDHYLLIAGSFFFIGFFIFGPQMLIGMAAAEAAHKESAGAATGFVGVFGYLGAALSGYPLAKVTDAWGWDGFFLALSVTTMLSAVLLLPLLGQRKRVKLADEWI
ncbi:MFS transporter family glucose-6-phosphate receptor UhpC [Chromobacterium rhizoryzae]|uniref:MFS transporter family glucose-6-phosphate receptor UhpC n=1 Tax=Chromobacterium rhizoryzae TaxID=1778675 RepID=UPI001D06E987|nr:MFS transporter family glucose-6-phosphate receptor UhpC [Chromobacterium rhizoryzae]